MRIDLERIDEPLPRSAPLARRWAMTHCGKRGPHACDWYHGSWQYLRMLGVFESIRSDDDFFMPNLARLLEEGATRILITGAADYALLARIHAVAGPSKGKLEVTVVDRCETPLRLNAWFGERNGIRVRTVRADVLDWQAEHTFDLVCTHSFICFFDVDERPRLLARWRDSLAPGGIVLTAQRARVHDSQPRICYSDEQVAALARRAAALSRAHRGPLRVSPGFARQLAEGYGRHHWTYLIRTPDEIRELFESSGFELLEFAPPGPCARIGDNPGTPNEHGSARWRILARRVLS